MMKEYKRTTYISFGIVIGSIIGLFVDMYQIELYGAVGLGIVYTPIIGLCLSVVLSSLLIKKSNTE